MEKKFKLLIPSDRKNIHLVEEFFHDISDAIHLPDEKFHALLVAVTEAVNNGIIHGNKNNRSKNVELNCFVKGNTMTVKVKDDGEGFNPGELSNPLHEENLLRTGGRGVFLMKAFVQSVKYNKKGNEVTLVMNL